MGVCLQAVHALGQGIAGTPAEPLTPGTGDSFQVPSFVEGTRGWLLEAWADDDTSPADFSIHSPDFHDNIFGIRFSYGIVPAAGIPQIVLPNYARQPLYKSDNLIVAVDGVAADNVSFDFLAYYENLEGAQQRLMSWAEVEARAVDMVGVNVLPIAGAAGDYGAAVALNATDNRLKANTDYAILGCSSTLTVDILAFIAPETSGRRIGMPVTIDAEDNAGYFVDLSQKYGLPLIPVINANNAGNVQFQVADAKGATAPSIDVLFMELS